MNILSNMSVNKKLMAGFGLVLLLTAGLGITAYTQVTTMNTAALMIESSAGIDSYAAECRQQEKNFQLRNDQKSIDSHATLITHIEERVGEVKELATSSEERAIIAGIESSLAAYEATFAELVRETWEMRAVEEECVADARVVENSIKGAGYLDAATTHALMLDVMVVRRDEKNFIMRGDEQSVNDMGAAISTLKAAISASELTASDKSAINAEVTAYQATFAKLVKIEDQVHAYVAATGPLVTTGRAVQAGAVELTEDATAVANAASATATTAVMLFVVVAIILGILIATVISRSITKPLDDIMIGANKIRDGDFGYDVKVDSNDELGELARTFGAMKSEMQAIVQEAVKVAKEAQKGNLDTRADVPAKGEFKDLVNGMNNMLEAVVVPVRENIRIVNAYAEGKLGMRVEIDTEGEFTELAHTLDQLGEDLQAIVNETGRIAKTAADGDLTVKPEIELKGDYNDLVNYVDKLVGVLSDAIVDSRGVGERVLATAQGLSSAAEEMNAGMEQLASGSMEVADGSQKLAELAQTTARDIEEVATEINQTSISASKSAEKAQDAVQVSHEVQEAARKTLDGLSQIQESVAKTSETVSGMNTAIDQVGDMGTVITDVADQTNMLGLNASIEAARAGEAGRGFAVVADAVKNLAEKVKAAAGESAVAIGQIQDSGENAIGATGTAVDESEKGGELLHTALDGVDKIIESIDGVSSMVQEIDAGAKSVTAVVKRVVAGMDEVASISEESASAAEESSSSVEEQTSAIQELTSEAQGLADVAHELIEGLDKFKVSEDEHGHDR